MIDMLKKWDLKGEREPGLTGVWVNGKKIGAIGIYVSHWVTRYPPLPSSLLSSPSQFLRINSHGFSFNISTDLEYFSLINPCGISDREVTSLHHELGQESLIAFEEVKEEAIESFSRIFDRDMIPL